MNLSVPHPWEFHPILVHFPIALLLAGVAVIFWAFIRPSEGANRTATGLLIAGVLFGWLAAAAGALAFFTVPAHTMTGHILMYWHLGFAITMLVLFTAVVCVRWRDRSARPTGMQITGMLVGSVLLLITGHLGGTIVFRHGAGVDPQILSAEIRSGHSHQHMEGMEMPGMTGMDHSNQGSATKENEFGMDHSHGSDSKDSAMKDMPAMKGMEGMKKMPDMKDMQGMDHSKQGSTTKEDKAGKDSSADKMNMENMPGMEQPMKKSEQPETATSLEGLAQLPDDERKRAAQQHVCPVTDELIGSMGKPIRVEVKGREVWLCCDSCKKKLLESPDQYLKKLDDEK